MLEDVRTAISRAGSTLWRDMLGMGALGLAFYALLHLPGLLTAV